ncbi:MAG: hypothetical protein ABJB76_10625 [Candidatus Nitrosocosmicus sp.]
MKLYSILIIMFTISICSAIIPTAFSIENVNNGLSSVKEICTDGSCTVTTCNDHSPCITSTSNNTNN